MTHRSITKQASTEQKRALVAIPGVVYTAVLALGTGGCQYSDPGGIKLRLQMSFPASVREGGIDGRMLLLVSSQAGQKPRFQAARCENAASSLATNLFIDEFYTVSVGYSSLAGRIVGAFQTISKRSEKWLDGELLPSLA